MEGSSVDGLVTILVKAPDQLVEDHVVKCQLSWTVGMLKDHLELVYPSKPKRKDQKVIFLGHVLSDTLVLKDVLQQNYSQEDENETFIVHLVCPFRKKLTPIATNLSKPAPSEQNHPAPVNVPSVTPTTTTTTTTGLSPLQQYYGQLNNQQMAWMQQAYAHYLTQYMQMMSAHGIQWQSSLPPNLNVDSNSTNLPSTNSQTNDENRDEQPRQEVDTPETNPPNNNNAGEDNEAGLNRDWLDVFDVFARLVVLCSIVYFYSSLSRFLIVTFLGFAIYLIQGGFFRGQVFIPENNNPRVENNNQPVNEQQPVGQQQQHQQHQQVTNPPPQTNSESDVTHAEVRTTNPNEERPGAWAFTWTFFSSFFASLIPEQPHVI